MEAPPAGMRGSNTLAELDFDVVLVPDCEPVAEPLCDPELFAVPVFFAVSELPELPELLDSWLSLLSLLLSPVAVAEALAVVREPPVSLLSPDLLVALSFTSDDRCDDALLEESSWR